MPFSLIAALGVGIFAIALNEKQKSSNSTAGAVGQQNNVKLQNDGSYRDSYGNIYQKLSDGSLIAVPGHGF